MKSLAKRSTSSFVLVSSDLRTCWLGVITEPMQICSVHAVVWWDRKRQAWLGCVSRAGESQRLAAQELVVSLTNRAISSPVHFHTYQYCCVRHLERVQSPPATPDADD